MKRQFGLIGIALVGCLAGRAADYMADGADARRTGWVKDEKVFNKTNVKTMKLLWKVRLPTGTRQRHRLFPPVILKKVNDLWGIETATGKQIWQGWTSGSIASPAPLCAMDDATGKEIRNSGKAIKLFVKSAALWPISGQVYVATNDAMIYAFGTSQGRQPAE